MSVSDLDDSEIGITISDGRSVLRLSPVGRPHVGWPTRIEIKSGPFSAAIEGEMMFAPFRNALAALHKSLKGEALLECLDNMHYVKITGMDAGHMQLIAQITDGHMPDGTRLIVTMNIDQSYLPEIIAGIDRLFPQMES